MLEKLFRTDTPFWQAMGMLYDIAVVNLLGLALSLPIVTAGAALTAAHDTARRVLEDRGDSPFRLFLTSFRANLRQGSVIGIIALLGVAATVTSWLLAGKSSLALPTAVLLSVIVAPTWIYVFAIQARFENPWHRTFVVAFLLAFANLRWTAAALLTDAILVAIAVATLVTMPQGIPLIVIFGYGAVVFANTPFLERALRPQLEPPVDAESPVR